MYLLKLFANAIVLYYAYNSTENMIFGTTDTNLTMFRSKPKYIVKYSYYDNIIS